MKLSKKYYLVLLFSLASSQACAEAYDSQLSVSLDLVGQGAFGSAVTGTSLGVGGALFADWRPMPFLSLGTGLDFASYSGSAGWQTSSWLLGGRIFPAPSDQGGEFYLQGTGGINLIKGSLLKTTPGTGRGSLGVGYRAYMGKGGALDFGVQYDLFTPISRPLSAVGLKVGWTFLFGNTPIHDKEENPLPTHSKTTGATPPKSAHGVQTTAPTQNGTGEAKPKKKPKKKNQKIAAAPTPTPANEISYTWAEGDQMESVAEAFLGRGNLYPLIVDANKAALSSPSGLAAGVKLKIPDNPTQNEKAAARAKADLPEYLLWAKVGKP